MPFKLSPEVVETEDGEGLRRLFEHDEFSVLGQVALGNLPVLTHEGIDVYRLSVELNHHDEPQIPVMHFGTNHESMKQVLSDDQKCVKLVLDSLSTLLYVIQHADEMPVITLPEPSIINYGSRAVEETLAEIDELASGELDLIINPWEAGHAMPRLVTRDAAPIYRKFIRDKVGSGDYLTMYGFTKTLHRP